MMAEMSDQFGKKNKNLDLVAFDEEFVALGIIKRPTGGTDWIGMLLISRKS